MVLDRIDDADFGETLKKQYKGEALFLRAYAYFNMYRIWGCIPTTRKVVGYKEALTIGRSSAEEMYSIIAGSLEQIVDEDMLPESYAGNDVGRITSGAAKALLGKVYLTFKESEKARGILAQLIGKYALQPEPANVFNVSNKMNNEIVFAVRFNKNEPSEGHGFWFSVPNLTDNTNRSPSLMACYTDPRDKRIDLLTYVQVESAVCVMKKFVDTRNATTNYVGNDQIILRYADVLLLYAEACNNAAFSNVSNSPAMTSINAVRARAGIDPLLNTDAAVRDRDSFNKAIMDERQREFPYEGHRWFDLVRMGGAIDAMVAEGHSINEYQFLFPIPKTALERINNPALLWQNPGY
jgi:hypothetical protein